MSRMQQVLNGFTKIDDDLFDELEETMITSDLEKIADYIVFLRSGKGRCSSCPRTS